MTINFDELCPEENPVMQGAWVSCLRYYLKQMECISHFERQTGNKFIFPKTALDAVIDKACNVSEKHNDKVMIEFVKWFNKNIWGNYSEFDQGKE